LAACHRGVPAYPPTTRSLLTSAANVCLADVNTALLQYCGEWSKQGTLEGGDLTPQQRAAGEKALLGLRIQIENLEKALKGCRG
jgi:hypothetical protein